MSSEAAQIKENKKRKQINYANRFVIFKNAVQNVKYVYQAVNDTTVKNFDLIKNVSGCSMFQLGIQFETNNLMVIDIIQF